MPGKFVKLRSLDEPAAERNYADAPNFLTSVFSRGVNMFSPYAVKAGTAQGEEEGEGIYDAYPYSSLYG